MVNPEFLLITNEYVREALDQIIQTTSINNANPLQFLHLVDLHMLTSDFSFFQEPRQFALNDLLISTIHERYIYQRSLHEFASVETGMTLSNATNFIVEDASTGNSDLIGWSWLYYHYVEVNLRISQQHFCQMVNLDDRTIRRYQNSTIEQLTKHLVRLEQNAREKRRKQILYLELPHQGAVSELIEREKELQRVQKSKLNHFYVIGAAGIGKTVFVEKVLKEQIDNDEFDRLVWVRSPQTVKNVRSYLLERLLSEDSKITLLEYVSIKKIAIVIDGAESLQADLSELQKFLEEFSNAKIFLMSQIFYPIPGSLQIELSELSLSGVELMLILGKIATSKSLSVSDFSRLIYQSVGGNPLAIELFARNWSLFETESASLLTLDLLFSRLFESMPNAQQLAWLILATLNDDSLVLERLSEINVSNTAFAAFVSLVRLCVANASGSGNSDITLTISASRYIQMRYKSSNELQRLLDDFVAQLISVSSTSSDVYLTLVESILSANWVMLSSDLYLEASQRFWKNGLRKGLYTKWYLILGKFVVESAHQYLDMTIGYGICQRCLGLWLEAHSTFANIVQITGIQGAFSYQAQALLELAILLRYQGDYTGALEVLNRIDNFVRPIPSDVYSRALIERIEIALESDNVIQAKSLFANLNDDHNRKIILQLEIYAKDVNEGHELSYFGPISDKLLVDYGYSDTLTARIHILIGRICEKTSDIKLAINHLTIAQALLMDIDNDPFALARTQSNLAALLTTADQLLEAEELLKSAENIQRKIGDRVGLAVTMHNEQVLYRKIVN